MTTTDPFIAAARAEAEEYAWDRNAGTTHEDSLDRDAFASGYECGAFWARDHLAAQEPTDAGIPESVADLIRDLTDPDDCWFDHGGGCQAHGYLSLAPEQECPHSEAKRLLAARTARRDEEKR